MTTFVLVHGAWSSGWDWSEVTARLRAHGHHVHVSTLTGLGERIHVVPEDGSIGLGTHIQDVVALIEWYDLEDIVLVGHSYAGIVITGAASLVAPRIERLFYVEAFVLANGQSLVDLTGPDARAHLEARATANEGRVPPSIRPPEAAAGVRAEKCNQRLRPMPLACFTQPVHLNGDEDTILDRVFLYATIGAPTSRTRFLEALRDRPGWRVSTIDTGHVVMIDDPERLTRLLLDAADMR